MPERSAQFVFVWLMLAVLPLPSRLRAQEPAANPTSGGGAPESVLFESLPVVEAATLHIQTLKEAPASITIISSEEIRAYGWRTFGEALAAVRGFYLTYDRAYHYGGLRGFGLPGDYNTRFLVMLNGHYLAENIYSSNNFFGQDFGLDLDLVKRIEIVRGPSSALYGSNGIFATINIVTRSPAEAKRLRVATETGSFGEKKAQISSGLNLGHGANLLTSLSVFQNAGQSLYFPEFDRPQTNYGWARGADGERGYHVFANLIWRNWSFTAYLGSRQKQIPTGWYSTIFDDPANNILDARGFVEAAYSRDLSATRKVRWRIYYDQYRYHGRYDYALGEPVQDFRDLAAGDWLGTQASYDLTVPHVGVLTVGGEFNADIRALQQYYEVSPQAAVVLSVDHPDLSYGLFAQQQWQLAPAWTAYLGARFDDSRNRGHFISPRLALVYQASAKSTYKFLFGRAFRNPNAYEMYYDDGFSQAANLALRPERANTIEITAERRFTSSLNGTVSLYQYQLDGLIEAGTNAAGWLQYQNAGHASARGVEMELGVKPAAWIETTASVALGHAAEQGYPFLTNSPGCVAKLRGSVPLFKNHLRAAAAVQYLSPRRTMTYAEVPAVWLTDLTLTTHRIHPDFDIQFGVRNLLNQAYYDPAGAGLAQDRLLEDGRALFLKLMWRTRE